MPYMLVTRAMPKGLARRGTDWPKMAKLPQSIPAAPLPEMILPTIKAAELGAAAQSIDPISTSWIRSVHQILCSSTFFGGEQLTDGDADQV